ncbi:hypothetical protein WNY59_08335 [Ahrensia kielensis]|uniref:Uncharacterized protein n=1 Tax=Ahrensia kielensis TaxID=76980 RepID=A0ABU9T639_9HYPH
MLKDAGVIRHNLLGNDGFLSRALVTDAFEEAYKELEYKEEEYEPWYPPPVGFKLILWGFALQLIAQWL